MKNRNRLYAAVALVGTCTALTGCTTEVPPAHVGIKFSADSGLSEKLITPQVVWRGMREQVYTYPTSLKNATFVRNAQE